MVGVCKGDIYILLINIIIIIPEDSFRLVFEYGGVMYSITEQTA